MRPAKIDTTAGTSATSAPATCSICRSERIAVTFRRTPSIARSWISPTADSPAGLSTGIFTYTFSCQSRIRSACRRISAKSSANTSKEIGFCRTVWSTSLAKAS